MKMNLMPFAELNRIKNQRNIAIGIIAAIVIGGITVYVVRRNAADDDK